MSPNAREITEAMDLNLPAPTESTQIQSEIQNIGESEKERPCIFSLLELRFLKQYESGLKRLNREKLCDPSDNTASGETSTLALSTEEVMRVAKAILSQRFCDLPSHVNDHALSVLSDEDNKNVELAQFLLDSAEKVSNQQYDHASALLDKCENLSSITGNPVKRIAYFFVKVLREKIDREKGRITSGGSENEERHQLNVEEAMMTPNPTIIACLQEFPFVQPTLFTGIQAIVDNVANARRVHVIDLQMRTGVQPAVLMRALVDQNKRSIEQLKLTAIVTPSSRQRIDETGKRLLDFAKTINLDFSFKTVMVSDFKNLKKEDFEVEDDEVLVVYSVIFLKKFLGMPSCLESLMRVIKYLQPCVMVVSEIEANHNAQPFMERFIEALFFFSAGFDGIEACMDRFNPNRISIEVIYLSHMIRNIVAAEGEERTIRHQKLDHWRAFFARFGMVETELSASSFYQAKMVVKKFPCGGSCTVDMNGKSLVSGWKGTPFFSVSAWKFQ